MFILTLLCLTNFNDNVVTTTISELCETLTQIFNTDFNKQF